MAGRGGLQPLNWRSAFVPRYQLANFRVLVYVAARLVMGPIILKVLDFSYRTDGIYKHSRLTDVMAHAEQRRRH